MSPMISARRRRAPRATDRMRLRVGERHAGRQHQRRRCRARSASARSTSGTPAPAAVARAAALVVPGQRPRRRRRASARAAARPERAEAEHGDALRRAKPRTGIIARSPQLQRREAGQRQDDGDDPEADDDGRLRPAQLLEMMVERRHAEDALAGQLEADATWTMTDTVSSTNRPPMMASTISCLVTTRSRRARRRAPASRCRP